MEALLMSKLVVVGGSRGLGFSISKELSKKYNSVVVFDVLEPLEKIKNIIYKRVDLYKDSLTEIESELVDADCLVFTAGIGCVKAFEDCSITEIEKIYKVNTLSATKVLHYFYNNLLHKKDVKCLVVASIAGEVSSPLFATYGASKAALCKLCESLNVELEKSGSNNRITCIVATSFNGTSFSGGDTKVDLLKGVTNECIEAMNHNEDIHYINKDLCADIIKRYSDDKHAFGLSSYDYKSESGRVTKDKKIIIGYLSGTFDLFHIGHLNLLRRAKEQCDYLIVGVHDSGAWKGKETFIPFDERLAIVGSIKYVDEAHKSFREDSDAWDAYHFDKLFVGSDYIGSERFKKYEEYFKDKGVQIVYFPYTKGTSSTQLRDKLTKK